MKLIFVKFTTEKYIRVVCYILNICNIFRNFRYVSFYIYFTADAGNWSGNINLNIFSLSTPLIKIEDRDQTYKC